MFYAVFALLVSAASAQQQRDLGDWGRHDVIPQIQTEKELETLIFSRRYAHYTGRLDRPGPPPGGHNEPPDPHMPKVASLPNTMDEWIMAYGLWFRLQGEQRLHSATPDARKIQNCITGVNYPRPLARGAQGPLEEPVPISRDMVHATAYGNKADRGGIQLPIRSPKEQKKGKTKYIEFRGARSYEQMEEYLKPMTGTYRRGNVLKDLHGENIYYWWTTETDRDGRPLRHRVVPFNKNVNVNRFVVEVALPSYTPLHTYMSTDHYHSFFEVTGNALRLLESGAQNGKCLKRDVIYTPFARAVAADDWLAYDADYFEDAVNDEDEDAGDVDGDEQYFDDDNEWDLFLKRLVREEEARERVRGDGRGLVRRKKHHS